MSGRRALFVCGMLWMSGCSSPSTVQRLARDAVDAMGGANAVRGIQSYVMKGGTGTRSRLGQLVKAGDADPPAQLKNVVETLDLASHRAALDYEIRAAGGFAQHRQEILTKKGDRGVGLENVGARPLAVMSPSALFSWGTQNSPAMSLRRSVIRIALAAAESPVPVVTQDKALNGRIYRFGTVMIDGETIGLYFDRDSSLIAAFEATDTETMLGDVTAQYLLEDYRTVSGVQLPHKVTIRKGGEHYADIQFTSAAVNDAHSLEVFAIPGAAAADVDRALAAGDNYSPIQLTQLGEGVLFAQGYSHNTLVVEFPRFLAIVEAPYTEAQTKTLVRLLEEQFPGKPIRYVAVTHPHYDHTGGVRGAAASGATIVAAKGHEAALRTLLDAPHTNPPDELATKRNTRQLTGGPQFFDGKKIIAEGAQRLELYTVAGSPHVDPMVLAYVPSARMLFQSDLFFPATGGGSTPLAVHLLKSVRKLNLRVEINAGGHGGVAPFDELVKAVGTTGTN
jgi:glyoxylase-like metal-dependent hydrolase (beta-lactamase superfamily II)